ncbi:type I secretion protein TolC [Cupriavidus necator]|uniref:Type I secretion protein TolC n=1 Tax=Cupriavidus necator TaxID=106590 RepID=A0A1U9UUZ2_CUPNE|nr:TolC family outer membrane protein [Cupriavidus necator]AQV96493.1 type I secretion protein TolC [Cupriavidus necator]
MASKKSAWRPARRALALAIGIAACLASPAHALGLLEAYESALSNDSLYQAAIKEHEAGVLNRTIGRSYLLPTVSASYSDYKNWLHQTDLTRNLSGDIRYRSYGGQVGLRQSLFNYEAISRYRYGKALANASDATFDGKSKEVLVRVLSAYTDTLFALDQLALAMAQKRAYDEQLVANRRLLEKGEGTRTDVLETEARAQVADADLVSARDTYDNAAHALEAIIGQPVRADYPIDGLPYVFPSPKGSGETLDAWLERAQAQNDVLISARHSLEATRQQVEIQRSGYLPRVDLVASIGQNQSNTINSIDQRYRSKAVGVELTIPLYSGGQVKGSTDQAWANYERARFELDDKTKQVLLEVRKQYNLYEGSVSRIGALRRAVESATLLITATRKSVAGGLRTNVDVLNAERQMYESRRDLARARYQQLQADMQLKYAAGTLTRDDMLDMAARFNEPKTIQTIQPVQPMPRG